MKINESRSCMNEPLNRLGQRRYMCASDLDDEKVTHCMHRSKDFVISSGQRDVLVMWSVSMVSGSSIHRSRLSDWRAPASATTACPTAAHQ